MSPFTPLPSTRPDLVTWIHIGDLHMVRPGEQNFRDLEAIVAEINQAFAGGGANFVFLPGDVADDGSATAYTAVRSCLDRLQLPWCAIVGDHDVHEKSFRNFQSFMDPTLYSSFTVGNTRFFRLNCFSDPRPDSFTVNADQLTWLESELTNHPVPQNILLMHCYPSDLKEGGKALTGLIHHHGIRLVDMGHTHYNEISNDGRTLYSATRSTGQIEEGPVGYTVITLDGDSLSWHFTQLGKLPLVSITSPADDRLRTSTTPPIDGDQPLPIHVEIWAGDTIHRVDLQAAGKTFPLTQKGSTGWAATLPANTLANGTHTLVATARNGSASCGTDRVELTVGPLAPRRTRSAVDQENALEAWPERGLLGTQLGPNKNGKKW